MLAGPDVFHHLGIGDTIGQATYPLGQSAVTKSRQPWDWVGFFCLLPACFRPEGRWKQEADDPLKIMVGAAGFEPTTLSPPDSDLFNSQLIKGHR